MFNFDLILIIEVAIVATIIIAQLVVFLGIMLLSHS